MTRCFNHEKSEACQQEIPLASWCRPILDRLPKSTDLRSQLNRARHSIVLNIAKGNGRFTAADQGRFSEIARGPAPECAGCLDLTRIDGMLADAEMREGKTLLRYVVNRPVGLLRSSSPDRVHEDVAQVEADAAEKERR